MKFIMDAEAKGSTRTRDMCFYDLNNGDVFMDINKELFVRTEVFTSECEEYNAVKLDNGETVFFDEGDRVWKYEGAVVFNPNAFNNKVVIY